MLFISTFLRLKIQVTENQNTPTEKRIYKLPRKLNPFSINVEFNSQHIHLSKNLNNKFPENKFFRKNLNFYVEIGTNSI
jgi:hypothetical protein